MVNGVALFKLFFPRQPNPTSGVFVIVPTKDAIHPDISVEDGLKSIISGGILDPGISLSKNLPSKGSE